MSALNQAPNPLCSIETYTGRALDLSDPRPEQIDLTSIANGLSKICRYGSQALFFYSVAEHAYWVSKRLEWLGHSPQIQLAGLHHDDAEALMGDITTPMKRYLAARTDVLKHLESSLLKAIIPALGLDPNIINMEDPALKPADLWALAGEAQQLTHTHGLLWVGMVPYDPHPDLASIGLSPERACGLWLARHQQLLSRLSEREGGRDA